MIAVKKNSMVIDLVPYGGAYRLPNGDLVMPVYAGWTNGEISFEEAPAPEPATPPTEAEQLAMDRAGWTCTRRQGLLATGPELWQQALDILAAMKADPDIDPATTWGLEVAIHHTQEWQRLNEDMQVLGWLLNLSDEQMDDLFRLAVTL